MKKYKLDKVKDKELIKAIDALRHKKIGFHLLIEDLAISRANISKDISECMNDMADKFNIPEKDREKLTYRHIEKELIIEDD